jgi:hypothetical protein
MPRASYKARREFAADLLEHAFFGAFYTAIDARKKEEALTRNQLGSRMGREKTGVSKLLSGPRNWQLSTIADLSEALGLRLEFSLVDRHHPSRIFTASGVQFNMPQLQNVTIGTSSLAQQSGQVMIGVHNRTIILNVVTKIPQPTQQTLLLESPVVPTQFNAMMSA